MKTIVKKVMSVILCVACLAGSMCIAASAYSAFLVTPPNQTTFYEGEDWLFEGSAIRPISDFDLAGTVVNVDGKLVSYRWFAWGGTMTAVPVSGSWKKGTNRVKILLDDYDDKVSVEADLVLAHITKVELTSLPKSTYLVKDVHWHYDSLGFIVLDNFDLTDATIKVSYSDGTSKTFNNTQTNFIGWQVAGGVENYKLGKNSFELTYCGYKVAFEMEFVVDLITKIVIKNKPTKLVYVFRDDWNYQNGKVKANIDLAGLSVTATHANGEKEIITYDKNPKRFSVNSSAPLKKGIGRIEIVFDNTFVFGVLVTIECYGDINLDAAINSTDALKLLQGATGRYSFSEYEKKYADVDADGRVNSTDALYILQYATGKLEFFKAEL